MRPALGLKITAPLKVYSLGPSHTDVDSKYDGKRRRQASAQAEQQIHATNVCTRTLATHTQQFGVRCSMYDRVSNREGKMSKWLHPASSPRRTSFWWLVVVAVVVAGVDVLMLESGERARKKKKNRVGV